MRLRWLARQFVRPRGPAGRWLIGPWLDRIGAGMNRLTLAELAPGPEDDVLEVGFGGGALLALLAASTRGRVIGVDPSAAMLARARRRFARQARVEILPGAAGAIPLAEASVDRACSVNNVYFWPDPKAAMVEIARVVRPGGRFSVAFEPAAELRKWPGHVFGFRLFEAEEVRALMAEAGFVRIRGAEGTGRKPDCFLCLTGERARSEAGT